LVVKYMEKSDNKQYLGYANGFLNFCHFFNRHFYVTLEETENKFYLYVDQIIK
jgi:hypothetical protein